MRFHFLPRYRSKVKHGEIFLIFLKLGLTSFGGPIAHLGYFRQEFVVRRRWLNEQAFADLISLCQFLPGPASSQVGFALGVFRGKLLGGCAAWLGFTLPSVLVLLGFAYFSVAFDNATGHAMLHGLKIVAVIVVAQAVWGMAKTLCSDRPRATIALGALLIALSTSSALAQMSSIVLGATAGWFFCPPQPRPAEGRLGIPLSKKSALFSLGLFCALLFGLPLLSGLFPYHTLEVAEAFYRSGALVFGGGHVVLPLLQMEVVQSGWVDTNAFLQGYGAAQAVPGPLFTFAAYLGSVMHDYPNGLAGALLCLAAIFLPGLLLLLGMLPFWDRFRTLSLANQLMSGINAAVVGILGAALYHPLWTSSIYDAGDFGIAITGFVLLTVWKAPPWLIVLSSVGAAVFIAALG